jgi:pyridoxamine 5'-phosphate oxidase
MSLADLRRDYALASLERSDLLDDPIAQFERWFAQAVEAQVHEPNAMTLATVDATAAPDARIVLLKGVDARGFTFFTDYRSQKGAQIALQAPVALVFFWPELERQIRIRGTATRLSADESAAYYHSRPRGSRIGAWASEQSSILSDRRVLDERVQMIEAQFPDDTPPPLPPHWGGFLVAPSQLEFWQGRSSRLHDRLRYRQDGARWVIERLSP